MTELDKYANDIKSLCYKHKVKKLYAFGSALSVNFNPQSDIDFTVDFESLDLMQYADNYYDLKFSLQKIFNRPIDLLEEKAIKNPYFRQAIENKRRLVYGH